MQQTWCAVFLPELSLQVAHRGLIKDVPLAIGDGPLNRQYVLSHNRAARERGVRRGMSVAAARALYAELIVLPREAAREQAALERIAVVLSCFTPNVAVDRQSVLLEISASFKLFGGLAALLRRVRAELRALGYVTRMAVAPTPLAAWLFAKDPRAYAHETENACARLAATALALFDWPQATLAALTYLALTRVRDVQALPRDAVVKRFGAQIVDDIDKAYGRLPDARAWFAVPDIFATHIELPAEIADSALLLVPLRRMLHELQQFLRARGAGTDALSITFEHGSTARTLLALRTGELTRDVQRWESLLRESLGKTVLTASVSALALQVSSWHALAPANASWLPDRAAQASAWHTLADRLVVRLGEGRVCSLSVQDDHRPERASECMLRAWAQATPGAVHAVAAPVTLRPLWLLENPRALAACSGALQYHGDIQLIAGPERIEAGWWDGQPVRRDYFVASNAFGEMLWVYRDLADGERRWYLHGLFA